MRVVILGVPEGFIRVTCDECQAVMDFEDTEIRWSSDYESDYWYSWLTCPQCECHFKVTKPYP